MANVVTSSCLRPDQTKQQFDDKAVRDPLADSRYARGRAALAEQAFEEAADLFEQALELAPEWIGAHLLLADAAFACGDKARAEAILRRASRLDATDRHGAGLALAWISGEKAPARAPATYVATLFDDYAARFETHLTQVLGYTGPAALQCALRNAGFTWAARAFDLGCGTGLCGTTLRSAIAWLAGVDLSPRMIALAAEKTMAGRPVYDRLVVGDLVDGLRTEAQGSLDLVVAADVFIYIGELAPIFAASARALRSEGFFAFTVQSHEGDAPFVVGADLRFAHGAASIARWLDETGFTTVHMTDKSARREKGRDVPGLVVVARRR